MFNHSKNTPKCDLGLRDSEQHPHLREAVADGDLVQRSARQRGRDGACARGTRGR